MVWRCAGVEELVGHGSKIMAITMLEKYSLLVSAAADKWLHIWDLVVRIIVMCICIVWENPEGFSWSASTWLS